jgi:hypothetical protein
VSTELSVVVVVPAAGTVLVESVLPVDGVAVFEVPLFTVSVVVPVDG